MSVDPDYDGPWPPPDPAEALIEEIEMALLANDGSALERAWYDLYGIDPTRAISVAKILRPLSAQVVMA